MNFLYQTDEKNGIFSVGIEPGVMLDFQKLDLLKTIPGTAPCQVTFRDGVRYLDYFVGGFSPVSSLFSSEMTRAGFFDVMEKLAAAAAAAQAGGIDTQILLEPEHVFLCEQGAAFCYVPVDGYQNQGVRTLLLDVIYRSVFSRTEDSSYVTPIVSYLQNAPFSIAEFQSLLYSVKMSSQSSCYYTPQQPCTEDFSDAKGGTVLISDATQFNEYAVHAEEARKAEEARLAEEARKAEETRPAVLWYPKTNERVLLSECVTRIGKKRDSVDFCIAGNPAVSRHHADIVRKDGAYYLIDQNSLNKSRVNGVFASPMQEVLLHAGDRIDLADEILIFEG